MTKQERSTLLAAVDERVARLYEAKPTQGRSLHLKELANISNAHEGEHQLNRPDMKGGPGVRNAPGGSGVSGAPHMAQHTESGREESRRFAREVARWLVDRPGDRGQEDLVVFAAPRFLGMLRDELDDSKSGGVQLREGEYAQIPLSELRTHPAFRKAAGFSTE